MNLIKIEVVDYETSVISVERLVLYTNVFLILMFFLILIVTDIIGTSTLDHCTFDKYYW